MSEAEVECLECSAQYAELADRYRKLKKKGPQNAEGVCGNRVRASQ